MTLNQPRFKPHLRVEVVPDEGAFVLNGAGQTLLRGRLYELVAPYLTGEGHSADELCAQLEGQASPAEVYYVLTQLERKGYLCEEEGSLPPGEAALWSAQKVEPRQAAKRLVEARVSVRSLGIDTRPFLEILSTARVRAAENGGLRVVIADGYLNEGLAEINAQALRDETPWLLVRPLGREIWIGPLFRPGHTGCWECLAQRLRANAPVESYLGTRQGRLAAAPAETAGTPATLHVAWGLAAHAVTSWVACGEVTALEGKLQTFDVATWKMQSHTLVRLPYCPACGHVEADAAVRPVSLQHQPKTFTHDGGHRSVAPETTLERYERHVSPITGAVTMLKRISPPGDSLMHVYLAGHNLARRHRTLDHLRGDLRNMSSGKGASDVQARASGLCEGLERYSGVFRGDEPRRKARLRELGEAAIALNDCLLFSTRQFEDRAARNARKSHYNFVPVPFDTSAETEWTPVWSLTRGEARYLPTAFCYYDYPHQGEPFCIADSNGNAAGNTIEEAILQGFLELVERDSVALWWYNRIQRPGVAFDGFADGYPARLCDHLREQGRELWALDLTSDLGVPVFAALSRAMGEPEERIVLGFGAHFDPDVALLRAVTEMNQMLANLPHDIGQNGTSAHVTDPETLEWLRTATVANQPYLLPDKNPHRDASAYARSWADDVAEDVRNCQALVESRGLEFLVLDQTRPEIGLPVVKVIVPGLRHFWTRYAPGRLYDVPVHLGWCAAPTTEDALNPIPMFL